MLILLNLFATCSALNVLVYQPLMMESHVNFMAKLADIISDAGHNVTVLASEVRPGVGHRCLKVNDVITVSQGPHVALPPGKPDFGWHVRQNPESQWKAMELIGPPMAQQCAHLLSEENLEAVRGRRFDVLIHEIFDMCGLALVEALKIPKHILVSSTRQMDPVPWELGLLNPFRDGGILSDYGSSVPLFQAKRNAGFIRSFLRFTNTQPQHYKNELQRLKITKSLNSYIRTASGVFLNTHPSVDSWRPSLRQVVDIGGIAVRTPKPLTEEFEALLHGWQHVVLISFGTVVPSCHMPSAWKNSLRNAFRQHPSTLFIWKYEQVDNFTAETSSQLKNVFMQLYLPQNDLLESGKIDLFITHAGQNSVLEAAYAGVPTLLMPMFGDQFRNARSVAERGMGVLRDKTVLADPSKISGLISRTLHDIDLSAHVKNVSSIMNSAKISPRELFLAKLEEWTLSEVTLAEGPAPYDLLLLVDICHYLIYIALFCALLIVLRICYYHFQKPKVE